MYGMQWAELQITGLTTEHLFLVSGKIILVYIGDLYWPQPLTIFMKVYHGRKNSFFIVNY